MAFSLDNQQYLYRPEIDRLYEKDGLDLDSLPEEAMINVEEDYRVCTLEFVRNRKFESGRKRKRGKK